MVHRLLAAVLVIAAGCSDDGGGGQLIDAPAIDTPAIDAAIDAAAVDAPTDAPAIDAPTDAPGVDAPPAVNPGFVAPTAITRANTNVGGTWTEVGDADWSCLGTASADQPATGTLALSGVVRDYQSTNGVGAAQVTAFPGVTPTTVLGTATTSDVVATRGQYTMTAQPLPTGVTRYGFLIHATNWVDTYVINRYLTPGAAQVVPLRALSSSTANVLPALVGRSRPAGSAFPLGAVVDCQGRAVSHAVVTVSTSPTDAVQPTGMESYYFGASSGLPVRNMTAPDTQGSGQFMVHNVPALATAYAQAWGFRTTAELASGTMTLLASTPILAIADSATLVDLEPRRAP